MNTQTFFAFIGILAALLFFRQGVSIGTMIAVLVAALLAAIPWYFGTCNRSTEPDRLEPLLASLWVWFRRFVGIGAGVLFLWAGWDIAHSDIFVGGAIASLGLFCIYVGIVGQGRNRADWHDDNALHHDNKRRYKWWL